MGESGQVPPHETALISAIWAKAQDLASFARFG
jgi:hypothetical protein